MANDLKKYQEKRDFEKTLEPKGKVEKKTKKKKLHFVVQHHIARKDHYDLRLEWNGTLKSRAIPKGPSYHINEKRLAIHVEDHPLQYRHFEGIIPKGQYGAGTVMIWDQGYWDLEEKTTFDLKHPFKFTLKGQRLKGKWTLIPLQNEEWLLCKEKDNYENYYDINEFTTSIQTGRTMKEIETKKEKRKTSLKDAIIEGIQITNPNKKIFTTPKITKLEIAHYYQKVAKRMLPYLDHRIISTIRCPSGKKEECFFKKHFEANDGLKKVNIQNSNGKKEDYYYIKDITGLIQEVQMNSYEFHLWGSKLPKINHPDMLVFDLDPDEKMSLSQVREGVKDLKSILDDLHLKSFLKTSGGKGYHVVVPTHSFHSWKEFRFFAKKIAEIMELKWPTKYVSNMRLKNRKNKIFIDWVRNTKSATSVAPYSLRMKKKITVSMPISWKELEKVTPNGITIEEALKRMKRKDPWENFFEINQ